MIYNPFFSLDCESGGRELESLRARSFYDSDGPVSGEYEALAGAIGEHYKGNLADLKEEDDSPDLTFLSHRMGWDARAVAMIAQADALAKETGIDRKLTYSMLRAGLPRDLQVLAKTSIESLRELWVSAAEREVINPLTRNELGRGLKAFDKYRQERAFGIPVFTNGDNLGDVLKVSNLAEALSAIGIAVCEHARQSPLVY